MIGKGLHETMVPDYGGRGEVSEKDRFGAAPNQLRHDLPIELVTSLSAEATEELARLGIRTVDTLATANPAALLSQTALPLEQIVDWVGQALLLAYFGEDKAGELRRYGVRTILNLLVLWSNGAPPAEILRVLCASEEPDTAAFLGTMLKADPNIRRLAAFHEPNHGNLASMLLEATAPARAFAGLRGSRVDWFGNLHGLTEEAYGDLSFGERLRVVGPVPFLTGAAALAWSLVELLRFGPVALATLSAFVFAVPGGTAPAQRGVAIGGILASLPLGPASLAIGSFALGSIAALSAGLYAAFLSGLPSYKAYRFFCSTVIFIIGITAGSLN